MLDSVRDTLQAFAQTGAAGLISVKHTVQFFLPRIACGLLRGRYLVREARALGLEVIDRCNLTVLLEPGQAHLADFLAAHQVCCHTWLPSASVMTATAPPLPVAPGVAVLTLAHMEGCGAGLH